MANVFFESASELATLTNTFTVDGAETDPDTITLTITEPDGSSTSYTFAEAEITKSSTGVYTKDITCDSAGTWAFEWVGTGAAVDTEVGTWQVFDTTLGRLYATVSALKSRLGDTASTDDFEYHTACFAASRVVEHYCQRFFYRTSSTTATYVADNLYRLVLADTDPWAGDLVSVSTLKSDESGDGTYETTWSASDYQLWPVNAAVGPETRPYIEIRAVGDRTFPLPSTPLSHRDQVQVTGVLGWPAVPYSVKQAALIIAAELFKSKSTFEAQMGFDEMAQFAMRRNPMSLDLLKPYRRYAALVA